MGSGSVTKQISIKDSTLSSNRKKISPSRNTPEVILDPNGLIKLTGKLIPENAEDFFKPIGEWTDEYLCDPADTTIVEICLDYINSAGTKYLLHIMHQIAHIFLRENKKKLIINWYYYDEDEDILEKGRLFSLELDVPFNFIKII